MTHSIFVRDISGFEEMSALARQSKHVLAHSIPSAGEAARLARRLADSYPESGHDPLTRMFWFRDRHGMHQIWAAPER